MTEPRIATCGRLFIVHHAEVPSVESARAEVERFRAFSPDEPAPLLMIIDKVFPLGNAAAAIRYLQDGHARGRVVITVSSE